MLLSQREVGVPQRVLGGPQRELGGPMRELKGLGGGEEEKRENIEIIEMCCDGTIGPYLLRG